jgi:poly [ADP-ribose] polymerase
MAMDWFEKKFNDKTRNVWQERHQFVHHPQKYLLVERDFGEDEPPKEVKPTNSVPVPDSLLPNPLQDLIKMIFNLEMMEQQMMEVGYDGMGFYWTF